MAMDRGCTGGQGPILDCSAIVGERDKLRNWHRSNKLKAFVQN